MEQSEQPQLRTPETKRQPFIIEIGAKTEPKKGRPQNEDAYFASNNPNEGIVAAGIFDGVADRNNDASQEAAQIIEQILITQNNLKAEERILTALNKANERANQLQGLTTATIALIERDNLTIGNVGDSRAYWLRDGQLQQITLDHGEIWHSIGDENEALRVENEEEAKKIQDKINSGERLQGKEIVFLNQRRRLYQSLGNEKIQPDIHKIELRSGDIVLLCTDGVSDVLLTPKIIEQLNTERSAEAVARNLIALAKHESENPDNPRRKNDDMAAVVIKIQSQESNKTSFQAETLHQLLGIIPNEEFLLVQKYVNRELPISKVPDYLHSAAENIRKKREKAWEQARKDQK